MSNQAKIIQQNFKFELELDDILQEQCNTSVCLYVFLYVS